MSEYDNNRYYCCNCKEEITGEDCIDDGVILYDEIQSEHTLGHLSNLIFDADNKR